MCRPAVGSRAAVRPLSWRTRAGHYGTGVELGQRRGGWAVREGEPEIRLWRRQLGAMRVERLARLGHDYGDEQDMHRGKRGERRGERALGDAAAAAVTARI